MSTFPREILAEDAEACVVGHLQHRLVDLIDLSLLLKQAHWCVVGTHFRSVHLQLDDIIADVRAATDEIAERIATIGFAPDGRTQSVAQGTLLEPLPRRFMPSSDTVTAVAARLDAAVHALRNSISKLGEVDPISEDLLIAVSAKLEKHLWMVQAQEVETHSDAVTRSAQ